MPVLGGLPLGGGFEEEFVDFAHGQALGQKIEGAVFVAATMTVTVGLATAGEPLDQRGAQAVGEELELGDQKAFALAQGQGGLAGGGVNPCHIYGRIQNGWRMSKKKKMPWKCENA